MSRKSDTIFSQGTILEPSMPHIGREVALVAQAATLVYINARPSQIAEMITYDFRNRPIHVPRAGPRTLSFTPKVDCSKNDAMKGLS
jgi:hypothetical protein